MIGERTWGKGSVQNLIELEEGKSALKLTTATYTRPNGHNIHRFPDAKETDEWGVKPDEGMDVKLDEVEMSTLLADRRRHEMVTGKAHEGLIDQALAAASGKTGHEKGAVDGANSSDRKTADEQNGSGTDAAPISKRAGTDSGGNSKSSADQRGGKFTDRQLQKALDYLTSEIDRSK